MTYDEMVEAVAVAMCENDSAIVGSKLFDIHDAEFGLAYRDAAKVAITALGLHPDGPNVIVPKEPTHQMIADGWGQLKRAGLPKLGPGPGLIDAYRAMLKAAQVTG